MRDDQDDAWGQVLIARLRVPELIVLVRISLANEGRGR